VIAGQPGISIGCDNFRGGFDATHHLMQLGRRALAFLGDASAHYPEFMERYRGYAEALGQAGLSAAAAMQVNALSTEQSGYDAATELLTRGEQFDAIVAASDLIAIGALRALQEHGIDVPGKVSVVGFDDIPAASLSNPPLTTVMQDTRRAGEALVDTLLRLVQEEHAEGVVLPTRLVVRRSCGATPAAVAPATPASRR
jgi:DNA-binding LacI/PurR family transcriptional regulator